MARIRPLARYEKQQEARINNDVDELGYHTHSTAHTHTHTHTAHAHSTHIRGAPAFVGAASQGVVGARNCRP